jgi:Uma2 family endonuclease
VSIVAVNTPDIPSDLTWDEFLALPFELRNVALIDGEVVVNPPNAQHELVVQNLAIVFRTWLREKPGRGDVSTQQPVKVDDRRGYQPDFAWYPPEHSAPPGEPRSFSGPPSLVVEILSPSTRSIDVLRKRVDYERIGIGELWLIDVDTHMVLACQRTEPGAPFFELELWEGGTLTSPLLEGFESSVAALFEY